MIRVSEVRLAPGRENALMPKVARLLRIRESDIINSTIARRSLDARKKPEIYYTYTVDVEVADEQAVLSRCSFSNIKQYTPMRYEFPKTAVDPERRAVIVGAGPAGLFAAYTLATAGMKPVIIERGSSIVERKKDVEGYWNGGVLKPESNVQFGEGGAGAFSDGKLTAVSKDRGGYQRAVLDTLALFGAPSDILIDAKPHIGTDILTDVVSRMREDIIRMGGRFLFDTKVTELIIRNGQVTGVIAGGREIPADEVVLAIGHSARDTFEMLHAAGIPMEAKPFAVGLRIEHLQSVINTSQYGASYPQGLPAAPYSLTARAHDGRSVYTFCNCPGGYVVNASSEQGYLCTNGMSYSGRGGDNANSAVVVSITPEDFGTEPLAGIAFQRNIERLAYEAGHAKVPVQTFKSFSCAVEHRGGSDAAQAAAFFPATKGKHAFADITGVLPDYINRDIVEGIREFAKHIDGFDAPGALLSAVESRTSSPVRILRGDGLESPVSGLYPCGEGAGYAGGIVSAAVDGIRVAERICAG